MAIFDEHKPRDKQVNIQMTSEEKTRLDAAVAESGLSLAEYVRRAINEKAERDAKNKKSRKTS